MVPRALTLSALRSAFSRYAITGKSVSPILHTDVPTNLNPSISLVSQERPKDFKPHKLSTAYVEKIM